jgi:DNA-binding transcriptional LysR family regulator
VYSLACAPHWQLVVDILRLRALRELALRKTMAAVAEALHISPSAVSQQISQLEEEAAIQLIERHGRGVKLTLAGEKLVSHAEAIIGILQNAKTDLAEMKREVTGDLHLAAFPSVAALLGPPSMKSLENAYPRLKVTLEELESDEALAALRSWQCDVALIDDLTVLNREQEENIEIRHIADDMLYVLLPTTHALTNKLDVQIEDLQSERWALDTASSVYTEVIVKKCRDAGFDPQINGMCGSFETVLALIEAGCSVSIMPGIRMHDARRHGRRVAFRKLVPEVRRKIFVAYRRGELRSPKIAALLVALEEAAANSDEANVAAE